VKTGTGNSSAAPPGIAGRIARTFIDSKLTLLIVIASLLLGVFAVTMLPREEEPQIKVPMVDVMVSMPGSGANPAQSELLGPGGVAEISVREQRVERHDRLDQALLVGVALNRL